jgi:excinuclease ABC subunit A
MKPQKWIEITGARQHNLKNISVRIPKEQLTVVTGPSGSGKSSLAFSTLFAEGQRRFMESLSTYARQFLDKQEKPDVDSIKGLAPTIAIEQKNHTKNSRSTVGTATEIYDYLRLLYAKIGRMYDPETGEEVRKNLVRDVVSDLLDRYPGKRAYVVFPFEFQAKSKIADRKLSIASLLERGFTRAFIDKNHKSKEVVEALDIQENLTTKGQILLGRSGSAQKLLVMTDRFSLTEDFRGRFEESLVTAYADGFGRARVLVVGDEGELLEEGKYTDYPSTGAGDRRFPELAPLLFSFNSPMGACETCKGFGNVLRVDPKLVVPMDTISIAQGAVEPFSKPSGREWLKDLVMFCKAKKIPLNVPWGILSATQKEMLWNGDGKTYTGIFGVFEDLESERYKKTIRIFLSRYRSGQTCLSCGGARLRAEARAVLIHKKNIGELSKLTIRDFGVWLDTQKWNKTEAKTAQEIIVQIKNRIDFLMRVGLDYLSLDRLAKTLSGGEAQRIALANQLGTRLTQTCYVLDEPSIGLHPRDTDRLISILKDLAALKNTVVVVEHDPDIIRSSDYLVDLGPHAGEAGGELIYQGEYSNFLTKLGHDSGSATQAFMTGTESIPLPRRRRMDRFEDRKKRVQWIEVTGCQAHNLQKVDLKIPRGMFTCVTGVSGSGKSTAVRKTLYPALARIIMAQVEEVGRFDKITGFEGLESVLMIDQDPIGRSPRSNPITFMKGFDSVRELFASTIEARRASFHAGHFSFNVPGGRCETCEGEGYIRVEMVFMEDMFLKCDVCDGKRYRKEVLMVQYNGKNINDVLNLTVTQARKFFGSERRLYNILNTLDKVGLGYLRLGQASNTLSGGESQRLKIARELMRSDAAHGVYILDEPTTGLHFRDIAVLLKTLDELVERGNTVIVIEHNLDVMKYSDWLIDFGPDGGDRGGEIVFEGTPEDLVKKSDGFTARYLEPVLKSSVTAGA